MHGKGHAAISTYTIVSCQIVLQSPNLIKALCRFAAALHIRAACVHACTMPTT
jgi:hypothetical protein